MAPGGVGGGLDVAGLGGDHHQIGGGGLVRLGRGQEPHDPLAARTRDTQAAAADRVDMLGPGVDGPDLPAAARSPA